MIDAQTIARIMPRLGAARAVELLPALNAAMAEFRIDNPAREAAFLAQVAHESAELTRWQEGLNYSAQALLTVFRRHFPDAETADRYARHPEAIANRVYANRMGNGDEASGDGWRYRGRGPIQITGRNNYRDCGRALGLPLVDHPEGLLEIPAGLRSAAWYWASRDLNRYADRADMITITKLINGGTNGLDERLAYYRAAQGAIA